MATLTALAEVLDAITPPAVVDVGALADERGRLELARLCGRNSVVVDIRTAIRLKNEGRLA